MSKLATTKLSSKGQVVIPEEIRNKLHLQSGDQFIVVAEDDVVILKMISTPSMSEFDSLIANARREAKKAGLSKSDVKNAIKEARKK